MNMNDNQVLKKNRRTGTEYIEDVTTGEIVAKRCTRCGEMKDLEHFTNQKKGFAGTVSKCKPCIVEYAKRYDKKSYDKTYYAENREKIRERRKEYDKRYYDENKEKISEASKKRYYVNNGKEAKKKYYQENREDILKRAREYYARKKQRLI